jgi:hypothetical protein
MMKSQEGMSRAGRIRTLVAVMVLSFFVQGSFMASALQRSETQGWVLWAVVLVLACMAIVVAAIKATALMTQGDARAHAHEEKKR